MCLTTMLAHSKSFMNVTMFLRVTLLLTNEASNRFAKWITGLPLASSCGAPCLHYQLYFSENEFIKYFTNNHLRKKGRSYFLQDEKTCLAGGTLC